jgi:hypothetical protein
MMHIETLVLFPGALGDLLCCWPALDGLIATGHAVTLAARADAAEVLPPGALRPCAFDRHEISELFASGPITPAARRFFGGFDRVESFTGAGDPAFAGRLGAAAGRPTAVHPFRGMRPGEHATAYFARCLRTSPRARLLPVRDEAAAWASNLWTRVGLGERVLALHPGSGSAAKNWEGMAAVADAWRRRGGSVLTLLGPAEIERGTRVAGDLEVAGEPLGRVAAVLRRAECYLGNDSGISHLAGLLGASAVVVFGDTDPATWAPAGARVRVLRGDAPCTACPGRFCTHRLPVPTVLAALT